jgi:hypothetical protein
MTELTKENIERIERIFNIYIGASFDEVQKILDLKEKSNDINLDIQMKVYSKLHHILEIVKKEILE